MSDPVHAAAPSRRTWTQRWRTGLAVLATAAIVVPLGRMWWDSRLPAAYSVMDMARPDYGGGPAGSHRPVVSVESMRGPATGLPSVSLTLMARKQRITVGGRGLDGYTLNGTSPGPVIRVKQGDLVQVDLVNDNITDGTTLHWHGVNVPNAEDGVAGVTQDAVRPGAARRYRFLARDAGTYWYHSHQISHAQVRGGLYGVLVVEPQNAPSAVRDVVAAVHTYAGTRAVNGAGEAESVPAAAGDRVRVRVVNTDSGTIRASVTGASFRVGAVDGYDLNGPADVRDRHVRIPAGGRVDLLVTMPADGTGVRVGLGGRTAVLLGAAAGSATEPPDQLDLLAYGTPTPLGFDPARATRRFEYSIGRRPSFVDGKPGVWWTINGKLFPDVPMFMVTEGDIVRMRIENHSGQIHPIHLHGHHAVVLSRNGVAATGAPWWVDTLDVASGDSYEVAFVADNPGIWMDHCHNLPHARDGLVAHFAYDGVTTPYRVGRDPANQPE